MHCHICDAELSEKEINWNKELDSFEPCTVCLDIAMDAAYSNGYTTEDDVFVILDSDFDEHFDEYVRLSYETNSTEESWT